MSRKRARRAKTAPTEVQQEGTRRGPEPARPALSPSRRWFFRAVVLALPWAFLLTLELALRLGGYGTSMDFALRETVDGEPRYLGNPRFTALFFDPRLARLCPPFSLPVAKPPATLRVFVLGSSAAQGDPEPAFGIARILEVLLEDQHPGVDFDVVNVATTAANSHVVYQTARAAAHLAPDLFVIYAGNNEVVGPFGAGTVLTSAAPPICVLRASLALRETRLGQLAGNAVRRATARLAGVREQPSWGGMEMFLAQQVRRDAPALARTYQLFEQNLFDTCRVARQAGVPVVLSTVAVNLRSCAPFGSRHAETLTPEERRRCDALQQEGARLEEAGLWEQASKAYRKALAIDPTYAELHFRLARCAWRGERLEEARRSFREALEWDTLRFRADSRINETIRRVATALGGEGVHLADSQRWLEARAPGGLPGHEVFLDHVHLSFKGNYLVSLALLAEVQGVLPEQVRSMRAARPLLSEHECARRLALTDLDRYMVAETMRRRLERPPFTGQLDHAEQIARFAQEMASLRAVDEASAVEAALQEYRRVLSGPSPHWSVRERYATILGRIGRLEDAEKEWRRLARELPLYPAFHLQLARTLRDAGRLAEAESSLRDVAALQPESALVSAELARLALQQGRAQDAVREARRAVALDPRDANALYVLARSLCRPNACGTGERKEAIALLGTALTITPESQAVRNELEALQRR